MLFWAAVLTKILVNAKGFVDQILFSRFYFSSLFWLQCLKKATTKPQLLRKKEGSLSQEYHILVAN